MPTWKKRDRERGVGGGCENLEHVISELETFLVLAVKVWSPAATQQSLEANASRKVRMLDDKTIVPRRKNCNYFSRSA